MENEEKNTPKDIEGKQQEPENKPEPNQNNESISDLVKEIKAELEQENAKAKAEIENKASKEEIKKALKDLMKDESIKSKEYEQKMNELLKKNQELEDKINNIPSKSKVPPVNDTTDENPDDISKLTDEKVLIKLGIIKKETFERERELEKLGGSTQMLY